MKTYYIVRVNSIKTFYLTMPIGGEDALSRNLLLMSEIPICSRLEHRLRYMPRLLKATVSRWISASLGSLEVMRYRMTNYIIAVVQHQRPFRFVMNIEHSFFNGRVEALFSDFIADAVTVNNENAARFMLHYLQQRYPDLDFTVMELCK